MRTMDIGIFSFCMCKETEVKSKREVTVNGKDPSKGFVKQEKHDSPTNSITDHRDIHVRFANGSDEDVRKCDSTSSLIVLQESMEKAKTLEGADTNVPQQNCQGINQNSSRIQSKTENLKKYKGEPEYNALRDKIRAKRVALRKLHAKLKIELNNMQKMRDMLDTTNYAASANLPQVIMDTSQSYSEEDFFTEFRKLFENSTAEVTKSTRELEDFTRKHKDMLAKSDASKNRKEESSSQLEGENQRLISDSSRLLSMLQKAVKIAAAEYKLKLMFSETPISPENQLNKLESALLELQRLKSTDGLDFNLQNSIVNSSVTYCSARDTFAQLFPKERILKLEKKCKILLAELHISALENRQKQNEIRENLEDAIRQRDKRKLQTSIVNAVNFGVEESDKTLQKAKELMQDLLGRTLADEPHAGKHILQGSSDLDSVKNLRNDMEKAEAINKSSTNFVATPSNTEPETSGERKDRLKCLLTELRHAVKKKDADKIQQLLVDIKSVKVITNEKIVEEAINMLTRLKNQDRELGKDVTETTRAGLLSSLESHNTKVISDFLIRAQLVGLKNCIEIMGAKAKLAQLQKNKQQYSAEVKKIDEYLDKIATRASDNKATVDLIMTLERAITVAEVVEVSVATKQRAQGALHVLRTRKQKVKSVKDELQRAVMECRHEAITCAIAEADSLPYFLEFDPLDGQIAAILDYAKNKISPHEEQTESGELNSAERRVKSNLKRAMKGNSSTKLESAISLFRKTYNFPETGETTSNKRSQHVTNEATRNLIQRAERKHKRMKKQEKMAEKEWIYVCNTMRENLKTAMNDNDRAELWKAVYQFKRELGSNLDEEDEKLLHEAKRQLREVTIQQCKANLSSALKDRDSTRLRHSLVELESPSLAVYSVTEDNKFKDDIERAKKLLGHLKEMEKVKKSVSQLTRSQLAEIHRYPNPPSCVRAVMTATYALLGENEKELKDWSAILRLLVKMGRESLLRRIAVCTPSCISAATARQVNDILSNLSQIQVQDVNRTAAIFFGWAKCVVAEVLDRYQDDPEREAQFKRKSVPDKTSKSKEPPTDPVKSEFWNRLSRPRSSAMSRPVRTIRNEARPISATT